MTAAGSFRRSTRPILALAALAIVLVSANGQAQSLSVQRDLVIGCETCGGTQQFSNVWEIAVAPSGEMLVVDRDAPMLRRFDRAGKPIGSTGRKGQGSGEFQYVLRAGFLPSGGFVVVDMIGQRLTQLSADNAVVGTTALPRFPTTAGADPSGQLVLGAEGPMGSLDVFRWRNGALTPVGLPRAGPASAGSSAAVAYRNSSVAISPTGVLAIIPHNERYEILRLDSTGAPLPTLQRTVERVRNTAQEESEYRARLANDMARMSAEIAKAGGSATAPRAIPENERMLKPHVAVDALRYDSSGRLWVRTMHGDETKTIFDVFSASGAFLGSVTIPQRVQVYALGGTYLLTASENENGIPQVTRWIVH